MKLSAKSRYGLRAMYYLGKNNNTGPLSLNKLAEFSGVSAPYLEKILGILRRSNLINATRGVAGGYSLAKQVSNISVGDVIRALEGDVLHVDCVSKNCQSKSCPNKDIFNDLYMQISKILDKTTLKTMIDNNKRGNI